ncbi:hypothetical protein DIPPA_08237 [Diplonema papillatum]|nr:hypothetical protein DIPPA_08237 [Diplonema papillatum]
MNLSGTVRTVSPHRDRREGSLRPVSPPGVAMHDMSMHSVVNETSRMLMELDANRAAAESARRITSPRMSSLNGTLARTSSPRLGVTYTSPTPMPIGAPPGPSFPPVSLPVMPAVTPRELMGSVGRSSLEVAQLKKEVARQMERARECEKDKIKVEHDLTVKLKIKDDLLAKLDAELHQLVQKDAVREQGFMRMDADMRQLRDQLAAYTDKVAHTEMELVIRDKQTRGNEDELYDTRLSISKLQQELERTSRVKEKLDEMLNISQRNLNELQAQLVVKEETIRSLEDALRDVDGRNIEINRALEDKSRTDAVCMDDLNRRNEHLHRLVDELRKEVAVLQEVKSHGDKDFLTQIDRMSYSETTLNERLATAQKTIDCVEAQLAASKAEQVAATQDAQARITDLENEVQRLRTLTREEESHGTPSRDIYITKIRVLEDKVDEMVLESSNGKDRYHTLQAEIERVRADSDKYRDAQKRVLNQMEQDRTGHRKALDDAAARVRDAERKVQEAEDSVHSMKAEKQRMLDECVTIRDDMKILQGQRENERRRTEELLNAAQERVSMAKSVASEHEQRADAAQGEIERLRDQLKEELDKASRHNAALKKLREQMEEVRDRLMREKNALQHALDQKEHECEDLLAGRGQMEAEVQKARLEIHELRLELQRKDDARRELADELERERDQQRHLIEVALREAKDANSRLTGETDDLRRQVNDLKRQLREAQDQLQEAKADRDRIIASFEEELESLRQANAEKVSELKRALQRAEGKTQAAEMQVQRLTVQLKDLEDELARERDRYRQLQQQLDDERNQSRDLHNQRIADMRAQLEALQDQLAAKDLEQAELRRQADGLQLDMERAEKAARAKQQELDSQEAQYRRDKDNWARQQRDADDALQKALREIADLKLQLDAALAEIEKLKQQLRNAAHEAEQAELDKKRKLDAAKEKLQAAEAGKTQLQLQILALQGELDDAKDALNDANKQAQLKDAELKRLEDKLKKYATAGEQISQLQDRIDELELENKKLKRDIDQLQAELADLERRYQNAKKRQEDGEAEIDNLRRQNAELAKAREGQDAEIRAQNQEIYALQQALADAKAQAEAAAAKAKAAQDALRKMQAELAGKDDTLRGLLAGLRDEKDGLEVKLEESFDRFKKFGDREKELLKEIERLKKLLAAKEQEAGQLEPLNAKLTEMRETIKNLEDEKDKLASADEVTALKAEVVELRQKLGALVGSGSADKLRIQELLDIIAALQAQRDEAEKRQSELEDQKQELSFLLGTRAQLVAQIMSLREAIRATRKALQTVMVERTFKASMKAFQTTGGQGAKVEKAILDGVQNTMKKVDTSKKIVEDIVGKYFTGYEKLQHGSSSGHYTEKQDPTLTIFDEVGKGDTLKALADEQVGSVASPQGTPLRGPVEPRRLMSAASIASAPDSPTQSPRQSPRLQQRPAALKPHGSVISMKRGNSRASTPTSGKAAPSFSRR